MLILRGYFMDLSERIKEMASKQGLNIKNLEINAGFGNGTIRRWGNSPPSADKLLKIANMLNTTMDFLMTGEYKNPPLLSPDDTEWLSLIHQLPPEAKQEFRGEIKGYLRRFNEESVAADTSLKKTGTDKLGK